MYPSLTINSKIFLRPHSSHHSKMAIDFQYLHQCALCADAQCLKSFSKVQLLESTTTYDVIFAQFFHF